MGAGIDLLAAYARNRHMDRKPGRHQFAHPARITADLETGRPTQLYRRPAKKTRAARVVLHGTAVSDRFIPIEHQSAL